MELVLMQSWAKYSLFVVFDPLTLGLWTDQADEDSVRIGSSALKPYSGLVWDGAGIEGGIFEAYDSVERQQAPPTSP